MCGDLCEYFFVPLCALCAFVVTFLTVSNEQGADCAGRVLAWLYQIQLGCPFDGRPPIIDVEFAVNALGMGAERAQGDHEFAGDLRSRKLGVEQAEHFQLTLA